MRGSRIKRDAVSLLPNISILIKAGGLVVRITLLAVAMALFASVLPASAQAVMQHYQLNIPRQSLDTALKEISRYTALPVRAPSLDVQRIRISAVLKTGDIQALKAMLKGAFGLDIVEGKGEWLVVEMR